MTNDEDDMNIDEEKRHKYHDVAIAYFNRHINWFLIQMLLSTVANTTVIQFQDLLGLDNESRMNDPSLSKRILLFKRVASNLYFRIRCES